MINLSNWRSVRLWESRLERHIRQQLRRRYVLWLHGMWIGLIVLLAMWAAAHVQMLLGNESLAVRYLITLGVGYLVYLLVLRIWAAALLRREANTLDGGGNLDVPDPGVPDGGSGGCAEAPAFKSGSSGDFGGGGATGDFSGEPSTLDINTGIGDMASGALNAAASADEGAIVAVPVVAIFLVGFAVVFGAGSLVLTYFGWNVLLAVAVELAFSVAAASTAVRVARVGWLSAAVRLTYKPLLGSLLCAVLLGASIDHFFPTANSLPQVLKLLKQG